jgi:hypothetical protein
VYK